MDKLNIAKNELGDSYMFESFGFYSGGSLFMATAKNPKHIPSKVVVAVSDSGKIGTSIMSKEEAIRRSR